MGNKSSQCIFCDIKDRKLNGQEPIYEDDEIFAFEDIDIASSQRHILICPIKHIKNIFNLFRNLKELEIKILEQTHPNSKYKFGFHTPPFNGINHLHMHGIVLPMSSFFYDKIMYGCLLKSNKNIIRNLENKSSKL